MWFLLVAWLAVIVAMMAAARALADYAGTYSTVSILRGVSRAAWVVAVVCLGVGASKAFAAGESCSTITAGVAGSGGNSLPPGEPCQSFKAWFEGFGGGRQVLACSGSLGNYTAHITGADGVAGAEADWTITATGCTSTDTGGGSSGGVAQCSASSPCFFQLDPEVPAAGDLGTAWFIGFSIVVGPALFAWGAGQVLAVLRSRRG